MNEPSRTDSETLQSRLALMEQVQRAQVELGRRMLLASQGAIFCIDVFASAALNRSLAHGAGIKALVESRNLSCSGALLRLQLDTVLRFYACFLVDSPEQFAFDILQGKTVNKMKSKGGDLLRDAYLVESLGKEYEWVPRVYKETSGYIHFSSKHILSSLLTDKQGKRGIKISPVDEHTPVALYTEVLEAFYVTTDILLRYIGEWLEYKSSPYMESKARDLRPEWLPPPNSTPKTDS